ncbi:hypothetical protein [Paenibacillus sp. NPDC093718]|uniref:hypothetical protein n=1 Tax=Paenibacillus sp. NPDC093718 TaxID=3390601 RepID=UPI003D00417F
MYRYQQKSEGLYEIYFTDGVFTKSISEQFNKQVVIEITKLLNEAYQNGISDGGTKYLKENYPDLMRNVILQSIQKRKHRD